MTGNDGCNNIVNVNQNLRQPSQQKRIYKNEPRHEKSFFLQMQKRGVDQLYGNHTNDQHLYFRTEILPSLYRKFKSVAVKPGMCMTW